MFFTNLQEYSIVLNDFSPNGDEKNIVFQAKGLTDEMLKFELSILDLWGEVLFTTMNAFLSEMAQFKKMK